MELVESGVLRRCDLVAVRPGEPVYDQQHGRVVQAPREFLKLAGASGSWCCRFYEKARGCGIYGQRPLECRLLFCRDTGPLEAVMGRDLLSRHDLLTGDDPVLPWLVRAEREVAYSEVLDSLTGLERQNSTGVSLARLTRLVRMDLSLRESFLRCLPGRRDEELFLLGRPLFLVIAPYGWRLVEGPDGVALHYSESGG